MSGADDLSDGFFLAWVNACGRLRIDPIDLIRVCYSESGGVRPSAHNPNGDASGIFQAMPATLKGLGWTQSTAAFRAMSAEAQIPFVERYYRPYAAYCSNDALCYVATFLPAMLPHAAAAGEGSDYVLCGLRGPLAWAYAANRALDHDGDGTITVADMSRQLELACRGSRYDAIVARIKAVQGQPAPPLPDPPVTLPDLSKLCEDDDKED